MIAYSNNMGSPIGFFPVIKNSAINYLCNVKYKVLIESLKVHLSALFLTKCVMQISRQDSKFVIHLVIQANLRQNPFTQPVGLL